MFKRFLHRNDWTRIIQRDYLVAHIKETDFNGYIALIKMNEVKAPLIVEYLGKKLCIVDQNYSWLQQLPLNENFAITSCLMKMEKLFSGILILHTKMVLKTRSPIWWIYF